MKALAYLEHVGRVVEPVLDGLLADTAVPEELRLAMRYSVLGGGKRLRPALCLAAAQACGVSDAVPRLLPAAAALELLHTYSLIHDDLPAMDDGALRRGKPACHRAFGVATALLAGDALQALAFEVLARPLPGVAAAAQLPALAALAEAAGPTGMCGGQVLDLSAERSPPADSELWRLQSMKTGALIVAAVRIGGHLAGAPVQTLNALAAYGAHLGRAFQIADDVLDVIGTGGTLGKDTGGDMAGGKPTVASRYGVEAAQRMALDAAASAAAALAALGDGAALLKELARFCAARDR